MGDMILSSEQLRIVAVELADAQQQLAKAERLLVNAGTPGGDVLKSIEMVIIQRAELEDACDERSKLIISLAGIMLRSEVNPPSGDNDLDEWVQALVEERDRYREQLEDVLAQVKQMSVGNDD